MASYLHPPLHQTRLPGCFPGLLCGALLLLGLCFPHIAQAQMLAHLTEGVRYDNCSATTSPNGKTTFKFRTRLISAVMMMAEQRRTFSTWGVGVLFYNANGSRKSAPAEVTVKMNNVAAVSSYPHLGMFDFYVHSGPTSGGIVPAFQDSWHRIAGGYNDIEIVVNSSDIAEFPAITAFMSVRSTMADSWADGSAAFMAESEIGRPGICNQIDPNTKPPEPKKKPLTVKVPDWNFGELTANDPNQDIPLTEKFCLEYEPTGIYSERLLLNVSNQNGMVGEGGSGFFKLLHSNGSYYISYAMRLRGTGLLASVYRMPNNGATSLMTRDFSPTGRTCFDATYTTLTPSNAIPGDYMDTLTFTVSNVP